MPLFFPSWRRKRCFSSQSVCHSHVLQHILPHPRRPAFSSSSMPNHSPSANWVLPMNRTRPRNCAVAARDDTTTVGKMDGQNKTRLNGATRGEKVNDPPVDLPLDLFPHPSPRNKIKGRLGMCVCVCGGVLCVFIFPRSSVLPPCSLLPIAVSSFPFSPTWPRVPIVCHAPILPKRNVHLCMRGGAVRS